MSESGSKVLFEYFKNLFHFALVMKNLRPELKYSCLSTQFTIIALVLVSISNRALLNYSFKEFIIYQNIIIINEICCDI